MKKVFFIAIVSFFVGNTCFGQNVDLETAQEISGKYFSSLNSKKQKNTEISVKDVYVETVDNVDLLYIFNYEENGFVVVSADYRTSPILAYSTEGHFYMDDIAPAAKVWVEDYAKSIQQVKETNASLARDSKWEDILSGKTRKDDPIVVGPLTTSTWNQDRYYNRLCPEDPSSKGGSETGNGSFDDNVPNGCVAVAMAQIMYYYRYPIKGNGSKEYSTKYGKLSANFGETVYDYNSMADVATGYSDAIARLIYHCGVSIEMNYAPDGSGSQTNKAWTAMMNNFKYSSSSGYATKAMFANNERWIDTIKKNLDAKMPLIFSGSKPNASAGHAWVCDGYKVDGGTTYFHFNWGWGPNGGNAFFEAIAMGGYTERAAAVFGLKPREAQEDCANDTLTATYGSFYSGTPSRNYPNNADCSWLISVENATKIILSAPHFDTELDHDSVSIYAGSTANPDSLIVSLSGNSLATTTYEVNSSNAFISFKSNNENTKSGFVFTYKTELDKQNYCNTSSLPGKNEILDDTTGSITNGSGNNNYVSSNECFWRIEPTTDKFLWFSVTDFDLEDGDELLVYSHSYTTLVSANVITLKDRVKKYTKENPPAKNEIVNCENEKIYVRFRTDNNKTGKGFKLNWGLRHDNNISEANQNITECKIYPNPARDKVNINLVFADENLTTVEVLMTDITGKRVYSSNTSANGLFNKEIDVSSLSKGIYFLNIVSEKGQINHKIVIQ